MTKTDLAYLAGIFDGEGCIIIRKSCTQYHTAMASLCNTNEWICRQFQFSFGGSVYRRSQQKDERQAVWAWSTNAYKASTCLKLLLPYLKLKRAQAEIAIQFSERLHEHRGGEHRVSAEELAVREAERIMISNLNRPLQKEVKI